MYHTFVYKGEKDTRTITLCAIDIRTTTEQGKFRSIKFGYSILNPNDEFNEKLAKKYLYDKANHTPLYEDSINSFYGNHGIIVQKHLEALEDVIQKRGADIIPGLKRVK